MANATKVHEIDAAVNVSLGDLADEPREAHRAHA
jgi:hypothetical protein